MLQRALSVLTLLWYVCGEWGRDGLAMGLPVSAAMLDARAEMSRCTPPASPNESSIHCMFRAHVRGGGGGGPSCSHWDELLRCAHATASGRLSRAAFKYPTGKAGRSHAMAAQCITSHVPRQYSA